MTTTPFERLVQAAQKENPPAVDVTRLVMERIEEAQSERLQNRVWIAAGVTSILVASIMFLLVYPQWDSLHDPLTALFEPVSLSLH